MERDDRKIGKKKKGSNVQTPENFNKSQLEPRNLVEKESMKYRKTRKKCNPTETRGKNEGPAPCTNKNKPSTRNNENKLPGCKSLFLVFFVCPL
jgi:hypothetical protein